MSAIINARTCALVSSALTRLPAVVKATQPNASSHSAALLARAQLASRPSMRQLCMPTPAVLQLPLPRKFSTLAESPRPLFVPPVAHIQSNINIQNCSKAEDPMLHPVGRGNTSDIYDFFGFRSQRIIGVGRTATVFAAHHDDLGLSAAVKVIEKPNRIGADWQDQPGLSVEHFARARHEAQLMTAMRNPYAVNLYEAWESPNHLFFVMQLAPFGDLTKFLTEEFNDRNKPFPAELIRQYIWQVACGLTYAHRLRVAHRDIKPHNIVVDSFRNARITDWGDAMTICKPSPCLPEIAGTAEWVAPEVSGNKPYDLAAADAFGLGTIGYYLMTNGSHPWQGCRESDFLDDAMSDRPIDFSLMSAGGYPEDLQKIVRDLMSRDPAQRPALSDIVRLAAPRLSLH